VPLADYKEANPTGVPTSLANAGLVERGEYLAQAGDCAACHTVKAASLSRAVLRSSCLSARSIPRTSRPTMKPASVPGAMPIS